MSRTWDQLQRQAAIEGFPAEGLERVLRLMELLDGLFRHPYLRSRLALKGGTAINLFVLDLPRLSVDVDLNYIGAVDRETTLEERPEVERAIEAVCRQVGLNVKRIAGEHAGGKWRLGYARAAGGTGTLELDLNFVLRVPLWPVERRDSCVIAGEVARQIPVVEIHELVGGKLAALFGRCASRDVFDTAALLGILNLQPERARLAFVAYGGINRRDWREVSVDDIALDLADVDRMLIPLLKVETAPARTTRETWTTSLVQRTRDALGLVLPLRDGERAFLERLNGLGEIEPGLITDDPTLQGRLRVHPGLLWKAQNVRAHRGRG